MSKNEYSSTGEGRHLAVVEAAVDSGDMVLHGDDGLHGVALIDTNAQGIVTIDTGGIWYLPVETGATIAVGDAVYCDATGGTLDNDPEHGTFFGYALEACTTATSGTVIAVLVVQDHILQAGEVVEAMLADDAVTTDKIEDAAVTADKLVNGASIAAMVAAGVAVSEDYAKTADGVDVFAASAAAARVGLCVVTVTETFAAGDGAAPTFKIGEVDDDDSFFAVFNTGTVGDIKVAAAPITANKNVIVTAAAATGTTSTGAISVAMFILPAAA